MTVARVDPPTGRFVHAALILEAEPDLEMLAAELVRSAQSYDEVLLVVGDHTRTVLTGHLGESPAGVRWAEPGAFYQRLGYAYERFRRYLAGEHRAGRRVHVVAEPDLAAGVDAGLRADRTAAYLAYEAICNHTYALGGSAVTCIWDGRQQPGAVVDGVRATHSHLVTGSGRTASPHFVAPERYLAGNQETPMDPPPGQVELDVTVSDSGGGGGGLRALRVAVSGWAAGHRFAGETLEDLVLAVVEVATNGLRHGGPPIRVRAWHHGATLITQCDDAGARPFPADAGYLRPDPVTAVAGGRGLWLARQMADVVTVSSRPGLTSVRLHFPRHIMAAASS
jgi:anti-sigma regulatory factor (Ser/Thr protein kinase)